jgi:glyoxylase-like metal-dependent hydrolase (beta-lactamase superfamily II)
MKIVKDYSIKGVDVINLGFSYLGKPIMTVHCFIIDGILIDTGQSLMRKELFEILKTKNIDCVLLTHEHEDHSGNAAALKNTFNIPVYGGPLTVKRMKKPLNILPYQHLVWGRTDAFDLEILPRDIKGKTTYFEHVSTPGHSKDHTVFYERDRGFLFSGDLFLGERIKYFRSNENYNETIQSLERVLTLDFETLFCAHRPQSKNGRLMIERKLDFLVNFKGEVNTLYNRGYSVGSILEKINNSEVKFIKWFTFGDVSLKNMVMASID